MPGRGLFCSQMSLVFTCHVLVDAHVITDVEGDVMLLTAYNNSKVLVVAVSWCGQECIMSG